jgi:hypothetical protein
MTGYGMVQRADPPDWNYIDATNQLSPSLKDALFTVLSENPKARVIYVDKLYVFRSATFNIREGRRLTAGTQIGALSVVTASGAYSFESSNIKVKSREASVLNVAGTPVVLRTVEQRPGSNATISTLALKASPSKGVAGSIPTPTLAPNWKKVTLLPTFERSSVILNPRSPTAKTDATRTP